MTRIRFRFRRPDASHVSGVPVEGVISCNPTMRVVQEDESLLLPVPFAAALGDDWRMAGNAVLTFNNPIFDRDGNILSDPADTSPRRLVFFIKVK